MKQSLRQRFRRGAKILSAAFAFAIFGSLMGVEAASALTANGSSVSLTSGTTRYTYGHGTNANGGIGTYTHDYVVTSGGKTFRAMCVQPYRNSTGNGTYPAKVMPDSDKETKAIKLLLYAYYNYDNSAAAKNFMDNNFTNHSVFSATTDGKRHAWTHAVAGYIYGMKYDGAAEWLASYSLNSNELNGVRTVRNNVYWEIDNNTAIWAEASNYRLYVIVSSSKQDIAWIEDATGSFKIQKCDAKSNTCTPEAGKDFAGIKFSVKNSTGKKIAYKGKFYADGAVITTKTTDANGLISVSGLPAGKYTVTETATNSHYQLTAGPQEVTISAGKAAGTLKFYNKPVPSYSISTTLTVDGGKKTTLGEGTKKLVDKVTYCGEAGASYKLVGKLVDETGATIAGTEKTVDVTATADCGNTKNVEFEIDASKYAGKKVIAYEYLETSDGKTVLAKHEDLKDASQTVTFTVPKVVEYSIKTTLTVKNGGHKVESNGKMTLVDHVEYCAEKGKSYVINGYLVDASGKKIAGTEKSVNVTATAGDCGNSVDIEFEINSDDYVDQKVVAFEYLKSSDSKVEHAKHEDINDKNQTISFTKPVEPEYDITTTLTVEGKKSALAEGEVELVDTVRYCAEAGKTYTITGVLTDENGAVIEGTEQSVKVKAEALCGNKVDMKFKLDASKHAGKSVTAFEYLKTEDAKTVLAEHAIKNDKSQTVSFDEVIVPEYTISTTLKTKSGAKSALASGKIVLVDTVDFCAEAGKTYVISGRLMDTVDHEIAGTAKTVKVTPKTDCESIDIEFEVDASQLGDKKVVAYEKLLSEDKKTEFAKHEDFNSAAQTVTFTTPKPEPEPVPEPTPPELPKTGAESVVASVVAIAAMMVASFYYFGSRKALAEARK